MNWKPLKSRRKEIPEPTPLHDSLNAWAREFDGADGDAWGQIVRIWNPTVGDEISDRAVPHSFRNGTLTVIADDPAWVSHLSFLGPQLCERLNGVLHKELITQIVVRPGVVPKSSE